VCLRCAIDSNGDRQPEVCFAFGQAGAQARAIRVELTDRFKKSTRTVRYKRYQIAGRAGQAFLSRFRIEVMADRRIELP
jgi:hypothetical protein